MQNLMPLQTSFPPLSYLFGERLILSHTPQGAPRNLCAWLNGNFYSRPYPEWQLAAVDWGKTQSGVGMQRALQS